jgi:5'-methylthioinosine phosphorylase
MSKIGVMVGSTPFEMPSAKMEVELNTPWGEPSGAPELASVGSHELLLLRRHGDDQGINPHQVNYRANVWLLEQLGVSAIIGTHTVGSINQGLAVGQLVLPDQLIDYTWGREQTYDDERRHVEFSFPYDGMLREYLVSAYGQLGLTSHGLADQAVYGCTQGPRLESAAEIERMRRDGCDVVGMTGMPEAGLARELGIPYASLCVVVNPAAGVGDAEIDMGQLEAASRAGARLIEALLGAFDSL